ncbi:hypothetical protein Pmar_PMAR025387 [Perkinsus marinus ATCC 50983]|uniref:Trichohyalin-plectin-homology domain-containing protein n=1 Tax=Perkinsus marinus (strain ATCC 50983 / TXsc) TaxID=423536 RepID=C5L8R1_PERM5|nr:hypothetical protein Pmar_PMAR025387 [Perkinsus marinus ATCC 50983]EER06881.1 hypothetical protein Pmar_PMAR025387 [Perkinsus marinus ATCC 50983]|eukprot:XP_002775065.1 hypothetical protein Pmar_PMAR025387 [Perkinsus marinus ATCC 50983]
MQMTKYAVAKETLDGQVKLKRIEEQEKARIVEKEKEYMRGVWEEVEKERRRTAEEVAAKNVENRRRMDEFALRTKEARDAEKEREGIQDKQFILNVLADEKKLAEKEGMERALRIRQQHEASDGLWDVYSAQEAAVIAQTAKISGESPAKALVQAALVEQENRRVSSDNVTVICVYFTDD